MSDTQIERLQRDDEPTLETILQSIPADIVDEEPTGPTEVFEGEDTNPDGSLAIVGTGDGPAGAGA